MSSAERGVLQAARRGRQTSQGEDYARSGGRPVSAAQERRVADPVQLGSFTRAVYRHAEPDTFVSLRAFYHDASMPPAKIHAVKISGDLEELVADSIAIASSVANSPEPTVYAPPICCFSN